MDAQRRLERDQGTKSARDALRGQQVHFYNNDLVGLVVLPSMSLAGEKKLDRRFASFLRMSIKGKRQNIAEEDQRQHAKGGLEGGPRKQSAEEGRALYEEPLGDIEDSLRLMKLQKKAGGQHQRMSPTPEIEQSGSGGSREHSKSNMLQSSLDEIKEDAMDSVIDDDTLSKREYLRPGVTSN